MLNHAFKNGVPARWVTADEVYGSDSKFRETIEMQGLGYVVAISCQQRLFFNGYRGRVDEHVRSLKNSAWKKLSCGTGTKGERVYQWALIPFGLATEDGMRKGLLVRR